MGGGTPFLLWNTLENLSAEWNSRIIQNKQKPVAEFKEFERRFKFSAGINLETFDTILSGTNHI